MEGVYIGWFDGHCNICGTSIYIDLPDLVHYLHDDITPPRLQHVFDTRPVYFRCPSCGDERMIVGVYCDRIEALAKAKKAELECEA
jgi:transcription elongation factor Elf1